MRIGRNQFILAGLILGNAADLQTGHVVVLVRGEVVLVSTVFLDQVALVEPLDGRLRIGDQSTLEHDLAVVALSNDGLLGERRSRFAGRYVRVVTLAQKESSKRKNGVLAMRSFRGFSYNSSMH